MSRPARHPCRPSTGAHGAKDVEAATAAFHTFTYISMCSEVPLCPLTEEGTEAKVTFQVSGGSGFEPSLL